jgi:lipid II:glycine glycyltransferase (peptidoglycan interpeptide bridge formation enzyme)
MREKNFQGPSTRLIDLLRKKNSLDSGGYLVLQAVLDEEIVAGISIVRHGNSATYLLGWNGDKGRRLNANNFLLWNAAVYLREQAVLNFDLGGLDELRNPGIASFKKGMNGTNYCLVGEYTN